MIRVTKVKDTYHTLLADVKAHLNIEASFLDDDDLITSIIKDATGLAEAEIDADIASTTTTIEEYDFCGLYAILSETPVQSITSINYIDDAGDSQAITLADCTIRYGTQETIVELPFHVTTDKLTTVMVTGYASLSTTPTPITRAILMKCADLYDVQRGSIMAGSFKDSKAFEMALSAYKKINF